MLTCSNIFIKYGNKIVVKDVSFNVKHKDYFCVIGENGSGKTTLIKGILGLLPLTSGSIEFHDVKDAKNIGYLPQQANIQKDFPASVSEIILSGCMNRGNKNVKNITENIIRRLDLISEAKKSYRDLSSGQQRRVLLARALCAANNLLVLDEPAAGLDSIVAAEMYVLLEKLNNEGMTIIVISHDLKNAVRYSKKILYMNQEAIFCGATSDYIKTSFYENLIKNNTNIINNIINGVDTSC